MADENFNEQLLMDKLSKLNSSRQSIESLSQWCISHRKRAKQVVEIWDGLFKSAQKEQLVSFLYLANDILQNSRRKGSEFVSEYWKVLPSALKVVHETGDENCRKVASRLVDIWEERKVFGSRVQNLKNEMLGENPSAIHCGSPSPDITTRKNSDPIKVLKRDKSAVGGLPRKILTNFHLVREEEVNEETTLNICGNAVSSIQEIVDFVDASSQGNLQVVDYIQKQENILQQYISQLESSTSIRVTLISQIKEALQDQVSKLDLLQNELHVAQSQIKKAEKIKLKLASSPTLRTMNQPMVETGFSTGKNRVGHSFSYEEERTKAAAAALAAQLTSISSSAQMLSSVLSSLVAEEVVSRSAGLKRPKLESPPPPPLPFSSLNNAEVVSSTYFPRLIPSQAPYYPPVGSSYNHGLSNQLLPPSMAYCGPGSSPQQPSQQPPSQQHQLPGSDGHFGTVGTGFYGHQPSIPPVHKQ
ncbi:uncharacterized protein LOC142530181 [Primulina tabacum]|uniref:uncharacterized protein LOC142530181 n=1 Tax=Primulina tabacum TaxID=48773 RepID=UPI003F5AA696